MRVALVHDYLIQNGGAERVLAVLHELFPHAPIYTLFHYPTYEDESLQKAKIVPSSLQHKPFAQRSYEWYLPLMSHAIEQFDLSGYALVISDSSSFAKGVITLPQTKHVCYLHTPTRFLWHDRLQYLHDLSRPKFVKTILPFFLHSLRQWDKQAAARPDLLVTNSQTSRERIKKYYDRDAYVIYPPVDVEHIPLSTHQGEYWLAGGRLVPHKRVDLVVAAFAKLHLPLKVFGDGPERKRLTRLAGPRTEFLGHVDESMKIELFSHAIGYLHPQIEEFGITAVEAMAAGKPVLAFAQGGATETMTDGETGHFFDTQCWEDIGNLVIRFDPSRFDPERIRAHALQFSKERFIEKFREFLEKNVSV